MRVGQIGEMSVVWQKLGSSSSPGASIEQNVLSNAPKNFETSINPTDKSPYATFPSGRSPFYEMSAKGIRPDFTQLAANTIASTATVVTVAPAEKPAADTTPNATVQVQAIAKTQPETKANTVETVKAAPAATVSAPAQSDTTAATAKTE